jgi:hypothetical protein
MNDERVWVPVEVVWDEDLWEEDPWRGDPRGRGRQPVALHRPRLEYGWSQGWRAEEENLPDDNTFEEEWEASKRFRQDGAGLSRRKRKKLRAQDRDRER